MGHWQEYDTLHQDQNLVQNVTLVALFQNIVPYDETKNSINITNVHKFQSINVSVKRRQINELFSLFIIAYFFAM